MDKFKKKVLFFFIGFGIVVGVLIGIVIILYYVKKVNFNEIEVVLNRVRYLELKVNLNYKDFDILFRYVSEFVYILFFGYVKNDSEEFILKIDKEYWKELEFKKFSKNKIFFIFFNKSVNYILEDLVNEYFIYYYFYVNDYDGILYLRVYFEKKFLKDLLVVFSVDEYNSRKVNWKWVDYKLSGFKKVNIDKN